MYWYKPSPKKYLKLLTCAFAGAVLLAACKPAIKTDGKEAYFDVKGYFEGEAARLAKQNKPVFKTIIHNGVSESKKVAIANWQQELNMFIAADINKPAWRDSYTVQQTENSIVYKAKEEELETREIVISKKDGKVKWILMYTRTPKNILYQTTAKLSWFPDSAYQILKTQRVRLIGTNAYDISGKLNQ
jgi:hypothetical protein